MKKWIPALLAGALLVVSTAQADKTAVFWRVYYWIASMRYGDGSAVNPRRPSHANAR